MNQNDILVHNEDFISRIIDGEAVLMSPIGDGLHVFNEVGTRIWELLDGNNSVEDIVEKICQEYEVEKDTAYNDVIMFLEELLEINAVIHNSNKG